MHGFKCSHPTQEEQRFLHFAKEPPSPAVQVHLPIIKKKGSLQGTSTASLETLPALQSKTYWRSLRSRNNHKPPFPARQLGFQVAGAKYGTVSTRSHQERGIIALHQREESAHTRLQRPQLWEAHFLHFCGLHLDFHHAPPHLSLDSSHFKTEAHQEAICLAGKETKTSTPKPVRGAQENIKYSCASLTSPLLPSPPPQPC